MPDNDDIVRIVGALDETTRGRLHRLSQATGTHPFELAAGLLRDMLAEDEQAENLPPVGTTTH